MGFGIKRVYEASSSADGYRVLVDAIWPRGLRKDEADLDEWMKDIAPTTGLRRWFAHDPAKWEGFQKKYWRELASKEDSLELLRRRAARGMVTLLFAARDVDHNNAVALRNYLERSR